MVSNEWGKAFCKEIVSQAAAVVWVTVKGVWQASQCGCMLGWSLVLTSSFSAVCVGDSRWNVALWFLMVC